jgi:GNAT superfamily N-acetyltransferase
MILQVMQETWPAAASHRLGPFELRDGAGGGKRVSAATAEAPFTPQDLDRAEAAMQGQGPLFLIRDGDTALDADLAARGYAIIDPVLAYAAPLSSLGQTPAPMSTFPHWPPLAMATRLWNDCGIGPERLAVMQRASGQKCAILSRHKDHPAGVAFVAIAGNTAMLHALEVLPAMRRQGSAHNILRAAALWAQENGADTLSLVVTTANDAARALYASFGMKVVGQYHYRQK